MTTKKKTSTPNLSETYPNGDCFIIMPFGDCDGYDNGHFSRVHEDIIRPACEQAGYNPVRGDDVKQTNLIHLDILQKLLETPMAICDLSSRNPNVLFELGLRQAFDKPTVLIQEEGTQQIFDISVLRYYEYHSGLKYRAVLRDQAKIAEMLVATKEAAENNKGVNSLVSLLSLTSPAVLKDVGDDDAANMFKLLQAEMSAIRIELRRTNKTNDVNSIIQKFNLKNNNKIRTYDDLRLVEAHVRVQFESKNEILKALIQLDSYSNLLEVFSFESENQRLADLAKNIIDSIRLKIDELKAST